MENISISAGHISTKRLPIRLVASDLYSGNDLTCTVCIEKDILRCCLLHG